LTGFPPVSSTSSREKGKKRKKTSLVWYHAEKGGGENFFYLLNPSSKRRGKPRLLHFSCDGKRGAKPLSPSLFKWWGPERIPAEPCTMGEEERKKAYELTR